ncbi:OLC1v1002558C1 [Oldenlandia corymbosa var. corymbosa]|uniref:Peroxidase n=1 Tax=Oldenlandia corymbosa var. corymbosa TaxID=529605 RepID=A0AAV1DAD7_OLDCO|nr:OLC1v1002558C1 [Oldenlandia corymbosa var. corymbosa]
MVLLVPNLFILIFFCMVGVSQAQLRTGFYVDSCPDAENIVRQVVRDAISADKNQAARLLRMHFHDCFVEGCEGSILIDNGSNPEKGAFGHQGVGGFEVIEKAKAELEAACPRVVSCADIVALAARDAIVLSNGPSYEVETGRRDGLVSEVSLADDMPDVDDSIDVLKTKFRKKGLTDKDLVVLSAAHTIGTAACFFMTNRLYKFTPNGGSDPSINPQILPELTKTCPNGGDVDTRLPMDRGSEDTFDNHILDNIRSGAAVLRSDAQLYQDASTRAVVDSYFSLFAPMFGPSFEDDFANAMVKLGRIGVKTGSQGTIRRVCANFD